MLEQIKCEPRLLQLSSLAKWFSPSLTSKGSCAASTRDALARFQALHHSAPLYQLGDTATTLFKDPSLAGMAEYTQRLQALDAAAGLNIFTNEHQHLTKTDEKHGSLVYKPCGASGGDIGFACEEDPNALNAFAHAAAAYNFLPLKLEIARYGVTAG